MGNNRQPLLMRIATVADIKVVGAAKNSQYYKKHGKPKRKRMDADTLKLMGIDPDYKRYVCTPKLLTFFLFFTERGQQWVWAYVSVCRGFANNARKALSQPADDTAAMAAWICR